MAELLLHGAAFAFGVASAILPIFLNAEAYVVVMGTQMSPQTLFIGIMALTVGTVVGKAMVFVAIRRGSQRFRGRAERREPRTRFGAWVRRVGDLMLTWLDDPWRGGVTVFVSALLSVPPLMVVTILAPLSRQRLGTFLVMIFLGRAIQFLVIGFVIHRVF